MSAIQHSPPLICANELQTVLGNSDIKVFDIRGAWGSPPSSSYDDYKQGHIPGAVYLDWLTLFVETGLPIGLASVVSREGAQQAFKSLGICRDDTVVLYDDYHHMLAGRVWWAMRYWGFERVKVLNGGWRHWSALKLPSSDQTSQPASAGDFVVREQPHLRVEVDGIINRSVDTMLLDGRGAIGYGGKQGDPKTGHVPGAINVPYSSLIDADTHLFKSTDEMEDVLKNILSDYEHADIISSCGSGYAGTVLLLALKQLGIDAPLFDGSFAVWKQDDARAIEQGPYV
ncbi:MAG: hypothetical protein KTR16_06960 [Acidiferrobacterales bacterium]|nr:hypothetical protein [Acidiferrobacterales bacterium]